MKQERVILSFIMVLIGLLVAGAAFYFYQSTKTISPTNSTITAQITPTPTPKTAVYLLLDQPIDESVVADKTIQILGQTNPEASVLIITVGGQQVIQPSSQGNFSTTLVLGNGENLIKIMSVLPSGEETTLDRTITYSTESF